MLALSAEERERITLKHLDGLSYAELAERLEIPQDGSPVEYRHGQAASGGGYYLALSQ